MNLLTGTWINLVGHEWANHWAPCLPCPNGSLVKYWAWKLIWWELVREWVCRNVSLCLWYEDTGSAWSGYRSGIARAGDRHVVRAAQPPASGKPKSLTCCPVRADFTECLCGGNHSHSLNTHVTTSLRYGSNAYLTRLVYLFLQLCGPIWLSIADMRTCSVYTRI